MLSDVVAQMRMDTLSRLLSKPAMMDVLGLPMEFSDIVLKAEETLYACTVYGIDLRQRTRPTVPVLTRYGTTADKAYEEVRSTLVNLIRTSEQATLHKLTEGIEEAEALLTLEKDFPPCSPSPSDASTTS